MSEHRRNRALAIKSCLDSLADDAARDHLGDLAQFIGLAALAAQEAAEAADPHAEQTLAWLWSRSGHC